MCSSYWNLEAVVICPSCGEQDLWQLQTHFAGDYGSCVNYYKIGETVQELVTEGAENITLTSEEIGDEFISSCPSCNESFNLGAEIRDSAVQFVWTLEKEQKMPEVMKASKTVGTIRSLFCPGHRRRADFLIKESSNPFNPDLVCPECGYRLCYQELADTP